jgi:preprotein translocase subunit SecE
LGVRIPPGLPIWAGTERQFMNKIMAFVNEVKAEIRKVTWPTKDELIGTTIVVCILVVVFAFILGAMDGFSSFLIRRIIGG